MDRERYRRLKELTLAALELPEVDRQAYLEEACAGDDELLGEVRELLAQDPTSMQLTVAPPESTDLSGRSIGPYDVLYQIGVGGMGVVYLASQSAPLRRRVALKVIKLGMDTHEVLARFDAERQSLALMDHPNIARVFDAGSTEEGRPYFVMEYIRGIPLVDYCEKHSLDMRSRLELFLQVCWGIQHAHQKGVIHRDIKPSNILVTESEGTSVPKIIDFGVAKALHADFTTRTIFTHHGRMIGTPEYMSPEQAGHTGVDVDTRSDVYSLGVVLYELLTGTLPLHRDEILGAGFEGMGRAIREHAPPKPSTKLEEAASTRGTKRTTLSGVDLHSWHKMVRGDLDWIAMKALEQKRERRYVSPAAFAEDIQRHLANEPVAAGPPSGRYRVRKFARRNRTGVLVSSVLLAALIAGTIGTTLGMIRANRAQQRAERATGRAEAAVLYNMSMEEERPARALPYILGALERDDRLDYRLRAKGLLLESPSQWRLPDYELGVNPSAMDISPDGRWLSVGWVSGAVQLYSLAGGEALLLAEPPGLVVSNLHEKHVDRVRFSPDSRYLVAATRDSALQVWNPSEGGLVRSMEFEGAVRPFFDSHGDDLLTATRGSEGRTIWQSWSLLEGDATELGASPEMTDDFPCDVDPVRRRLVQATGNDLWIFDLGNLEAGPRRRLGRHDSTIAVVAIAPHGTRAVSVDETGTLMTWNLDDANAAPTSRRLDVTRPWFAEFDATGRKVAIGGSGGLAVVDVEAGAAVHPLRLRGEGNLLFAGDFHPGADWIVTIGDRREVCAWPVGGEEVARLRWDESIVDDMAFTPDGRRLLVVLRNGSVWCQDLIHDPPGDPVLLYRNVDGRLRISGMDSLGRMAWLAFAKTSDQKTGLLHLHLDGSGSQILPGTSPSICVSLDGSHAAQILDEDGEFVEVLDLESGTRHDLRAHREQFTSVTSFLADGRLVVGKPGEAFGIWDDAAELYTPFDMGPVEFVWAAADGVQVLGMDGEYGTWRLDPTTSTWTAIPLKHSSYSFPWLKGAAFDPSFSYMVSGKHDDLAHYRMVDLATGEEHLFPLFPDLSSWGAIDPAGKWIATTSDEANGLVKLVRRPAGAAFELLPREELLARLRSATNLRAIADAEQSLGFVLVGESIPDWGRAPVALTDFRSGSGPASK